VGGAGRILGYGFGVLFTVFGGIQIQGSLQSIHSEYELDTMPPRPGMLHAGRMIYPNPVHFHECVIVIEVVCLSAMWLALARRQYLFMVCFMLVQLTTGIAVDATLG
jgi:hypothetical protein